MFAQWRIYGLSFLKGGGSISQRSCIREHMLIPDFVKFWIDGPLRAGRSCCGEETTKESWNRWSEFYKAPRSRVVLRFLRTQSAGAFGIPFYLWVSDGSFILGERRQTTSRKISISKRFQCQETEDTDASVPHSKWIPRSISSSLKHFHLFQVKSMLKKTSMAGQQHMLFLECQCSHQASLTLILIAQHCLWVTNPHICFEGLSLEKKHIWLSYAIGATFIRLYIAVSAKPVKIGVCDITIFDCGQLKCLYEIQVGFLSTDIFLSVLHVSHSQAVLLFPASFISEHSFISLFSLTSG